MLTRFMEVYEQVLPTIESYSNRSEYGFLAYGLDRNDLKQEALIVLNKIVGLKRYQRKRVKELAPIFVTSMKNRFRNILKHHKSMERHFGGRLIHPDSLLVEGGDSLWQALKIRKQYTFDGTTVDGIRDAINAVLPNSLKPLFKDMMKSYTNVSKWGTPFRINILSAKYHISKQAICKKIKRITAIATEVLGEGEEE